MINDDEEHSIKYKEYLENYSNTIATVLPTEEPEYSLSMGDEHLSTISKTKSDEEFSGELKVTSIVDEEIDIFIGADDLMPLGIESDDYDSEGDIQFFEELLSNDTPPILENKSSNFDHHDDPSFPHPPPEPPDVETFFDIDVIDEFLEEDFDALLDEGSKILHSIKGTILEEKLFAKLKEFMNKADLEEQSFDDLFNNLKIYEAEVYL
nr:hypothetical protein [Tanacetum cinerariifolium]